MGALRASSGGIFNYPGCTRQGFVENPYDSCVMNKDINGSQCTIFWHVGDLKISYKDPAVVDKILRIFTFLQFQELANER